MLSKRAELTLIHRGLGDGAGAGAGAAGAGAGATGTGAGTGAAAGACHSNPVLSCLVFWPLLWRPRRSIKTVLFVPEKWAWPSEKGAWRGGIEGARCPAPCHAPLGSLGGASGHFLAGKTPFFRRFSSLVFGYFVPRKWAWPSEGGVAGCPAPMGLLGGLYL